MRAGRYAGRVGEETLRDIGEFGLIARVTRQLVANADVVLGPGDDAAVISTPDGRVVATTDMLVEGRHFRLDWSSPYDVGRKAAAQNLADIVAMGARPTALLVALGAPPDFAVAAAEELTHGLADECARAGASVVGGDVVRHDCLVLGVTALGDLEGRPPVTRGGAQVGDVVVLAGRPGWSAAGFALLESGRTGFDALVAAHRAPHPDYASGLALARAGATAMIDTSDGLLADLGHIAGASGVGVELTLEMDAELAHAGKALGLDPWTWLLNGGEDHVFVATMPSGYGGGVGYVAAAGGLRVNGELVDPAGWDHFR